MLPATDDRFHPLGRWMPDHATSEVSPADPVAVRERVLVRLTPDPRDSLVVLAAVLKTFDAARGTQVLLVVEGVTTPGSAEARAVEDLLPELTDDPDSLPEIELEGDDGRLDEEVDLVVSATGTAWGDADTVLQLGGLSCS